MHVRFPVRVANDILPFVDLTIASWNGMSAFRDMLNAAISNLDKCL